MLVLLRCLCCDLLSKFISLVFWYNFTLWSLSINTVVICFRNLYLWYSDTTRYAKDWNVSGLWFAFEIYIFGILIQHIAPDSLTFFSCDLLSKFISLVFWYNRRLVNGFRRSVVICFRNLYLWYSDTTKSKSRRR